MVKRFYCDVIKLSLIIELGNHNVVKLDSYGQEFKIENKTYLIEIFDMHVCISEKEDDETYNLMLR